jgi:hypothetical protein
VINPSAAGTDVSDTEMIIDYPILTGTLFQLNEEAKQKWIAQKIEKIRDEDIEFIPYPTNG